MVFPLANGEVCPIRPDGSMVFGSTAPTGGPIDSPSFTPKVSPNQIWTQEDHRAFIKAGGTSISFDRCGGSCISWSFAKKTFRANGASNGHTH